MLAAVRLVIGFGEVMMLHKGLAVMFRKYGSELVRISFVNGFPGFMREADGELQTTALEFEGDKVIAIYVMRNPDKLRHLH